MSFKEMAIKREEEASLLEDIEIWTSIVSKFVTMEFPLESRAEMLLQAVGDDKEIIIKALKVCVEKKMVTAKQSEDMIQAISK